MSVRAVFFFFFLRLSASMVYVSQLSWHLARGGEGGSSAKRRWRRELLSALHPSPMSFFTVHIISK